MSRKQYVAGTEAPFIVGADGPDRLLFTVLDNLIAEKKVPVMIAISIGNGSGDAQGSERGLEYDTMSGRYAEFVETEVLPLVEKECQVKLTHDPDGRATTGCSSGASCALIMAWYRPDLYHRVLSFSGTFVNQQWPPNAETPHGAWEFHEHLITNTPPKPLRIWMEVGDRDLLNPNIMRDNMHDWVVANENTAKVLAAKGYHYQFTFARNAGHCGRGVKQQTLGEAARMALAGVSDRQASVRNVAARCVPSARAVGILRTHCGFADLDLEVVGTDLVAIILPRAANRLEPLVNLQSSRLIPAESGRRRWHSCRPHGTALRRL